MNEVFVLADPRRNASMCRKAALYVVAVTLFMWCLSVPQAARAATLTVGQKSAACPKPLYLTIQSAVNAASSGDTIHVCAGTYRNRF